MIEGASGNIQQETHKVNKPEIKYLYYICKTLQEVKDIKLNTQLDEEKRKQAVVRAWKCFNRMQIEIPNFTEEFFTNFDSSKPQRQDSLVFLTFSQELFNLLLSVVNKITHPEKEKFAVMQGTPWNALRAFLNKHAAQIDGFFNNEFDMFTHEDIDGVTADPFYKISLEDERKIEESVAQQIYTDRPTELTRTNTHKVQEKNNAIAEIEKQSNFILEYIFQKLLEFIKTENEKQRKNLVNLIFAAFYQLQMSSVRSVTTFALAKIDLTDVPEIQHHFFKDNNIYHPCFQEGKNTSNLFAYTLFDCTLHLKTATDTKNEHNLSVYTEILKGILEQHSNKVEETPTDFTEIEQICKEIVVPDANAPEFKIINDIITDTKSIDMIQDEETLINDITEYSNNLRNISVQELENTQFVNTRQGCLEYIFNIFKKLQKNYPHKYRFFDRDGIAICPPQNTQIPVKYLFRCALNFQKDLDENPKVPFKGENIANLEFILGHYGVISPAPKIKLSEHRRQLILAYIYKLFKQNILIQLDDHQKYEVLTQVWKALYLLHPEFFDFARLNQPIYPQDPNESIDHEIFNCVSILFSALPDDENTLSILESVLNKAEIDKRINPSLLEEKSMEEVENDVNNTLLPGIPTGRSTFNFIGNKIEIYHQDKTAFDMMALSMLQQIVKRKFDIKDQDSDTVSRNKKDIQIRWIKLFNDYNVGSRQNWENYQEIIEYIEKHNTYFAQCRLREELTAILREEAYRLNNENINIYIKTTSDKVIDAFYNYARYLILDYSENEHKNAFILCPIVKSYFDDLLKKYSIRTLNDLAIASENCKSAVAKLKNQWHDELARKFIDYTNQKNMPVDYSEVSTVCNYYGFPLIDVIGKDDDIDDIDDIENNNTLKFFVPVILEYSDIENAQIQDNPDEIIRQWLKLGILQVKPARDKEENSRQYLLSVPLDQFEEKFSDLIDKFILPNGKISLSKLTDAQKNFLVTKDVLIEEKIYHSKDDIEYTYSMNPDINMSLEEIKKHLAEAFDQDHLFELCSPKHAWLKHKSSSKHYQLTIQPEKHAPGAYCRSFYDVGVRKEEGKFTKPTTYWRLKEPKDTIILKIFMLKLNKKLQQKDKTCIDQIEKELMRLFKEYDRRDISLEVGIIDERLRSAYLLYRETKNNINDLFLNDGEKTRAINAYLRHVSEEDLPLTEGLMAAYYDSPNIWCKQPDGSLFPYQLSSSSDHFLVTFDGKGNSVFKELKAEKMPTERILLHAPVYTHSTAGITAENMDHEFQPDDKIWNWKKLLSEVELLMHWQTSDINGYMPITQGGGKYDEDIALQIEVIEQMLHNCIRGLEIMKRKPALISHMLDSVVKSNTFEEDFELYVQKLSLIYPAYLEIKNLGHVRGVTGIRKEAEAPLKRAQDLFREAKGEKKDKNGEYSTPYKDPYKPLSREFLPVALQIGSESTTDVGPDRTFKYFTIDKQCKQNAIVTDYSVGTVTTKVKEIKAVESTPFWGSRWMKRLIASAFWSGGLIGGGIQLGDYFGHDVVGPYIVQFLGLNCETPVSCAEVEEVKQQWGQTFKTAFGVVGGVTSLVSYYLWITKLWLKEYMGYEEREVVDKLPPDVEELLAVEDYTIRMSGAGASLLNFDPLQANREIDMFGGGDDASLFNPLYGVSPVSAGSQERIYSPRQAIPMESDPGATLTRIDYSDKEPTLGTHGFFSPRPGASLLGFSFNQQMKDIKAQLSQLKDKVQSNSDQETLTKVNKLIQIIENKDILLQNPQLLVHAQNEINLILIHYQDNQDELRKALLETARNLANVLKQMNRGLDSNNDNVLPEINIKGKVFDGTNTLARETDVDALTQRYYAINVRFKQFQLKSKDQIENDCQNDIDKVKQYFKQDKIDLHTAMNLLKTLENNNFLKAAGQGLKLPVSGNTFHMFSSSKSKSEINSDSDNDQDGDNQFVGLEEDVPLMPAASGSNYGTYGPATKGANNV